MNLHGVVVGAISAVNPQVSGSIQVSTGFIVGADGTPTPTYSTVTGKLQVQAIDEHDLKHLEGLNLEGIFRKVYAYGELNGVVRNLQKGGDLLTFSGNLWKIIKITETWPDWCSVIVQQQVSA